MAKQEMTFEAIMADLQARRFAPVYYLMGEEPYYIDLIADYITDHVLADEEKDFNLTVVYGADVDTAQVVTTAKRYPMMAEHQVVVVREAQALKHIDELSFYLQKPLASTILVFCHKNGVLDRRKKLAADIAKVGVLYESKKLKDTQLPQFIERYLRERGLGIDPKAAAMMADCVGADLSRLTGELEKLIISKPKELTAITPELIEKNIGISKDFNNFELRNAIITRNVYKANQIIKYFADNPKANPIQMTLALLFSFFSNLMLAYYAPQKSDTGVAEFLGLRSPWAAKDYITAMRSYSGVKVMQIISDIRYTDAMSKGVGNASLDNRELMRELIYKILH